MLVFEFGKEVGINVLKYLNILECWFGVKEFIVGDIFFIVDIIVLCVMDFVCVVKICMIDEYVNLVCWYEVVSNRESVKV